ncbi:MAG TPA: hypothetical protein VGP03_00260 [Pseudonocardiaceae bacterium]|nr:hypothetical protein [Pseudonocardiaceae bacterium]
MNLRKTIAGAAVALGSATVMLGLGGTANAAVDGHAGTTPNLDAELGKVASVGSLGSIDTNDPNGKVQAINTQDLTGFTHAENVDAQLAETLLGLSEPQGPSHADAGVGF